MIIEILSGGATILPLDAGMWRCVSLGEKQFLLEPNSPKKRRETVGQTLQPTIAHGMVTVDFRPEERTVSMTGTFFENQLSILKFFEWHGKVSYIQGNSVSVQLSSCTVCGGVDPADSNAMLPEYRKQYLERAGHKEECPLSEQIKTLERLIGQATLENKNQPTLGSSNERSVRKI